MAGRVEALSAPRLVEINWRREIMRVSERMDCPLINRILQIGKQPCRLSGENHCHSDCKELAHAAHVRNRWDL